MRVPQRGRAILRRVSAHDPVRVFRPGDFVLTSSPGGLARILGWCTGSKINHAAIIVDPMGAVVEATPSLLTDARAFRLTTVAEYLRTGQPCWIGYVELREGTRQEVVAYAEHLLRARCITGGMGRVWLALHMLLNVAPRALTGKLTWLRSLHPLFDQHALVLREEYCYSSSELVARALERGGFIWDRDAAHITPDDLFQRYHLADAPVTLAPKPISQARRARALASAPRDAGRGPGSISQFAPRTTQGATALAEAPETAAHAQVGMRALVHVGVFMAAGLALIGVIEEMLRGVSSNA